MDERAEAFVRNEIARTVDLLAAMGSDHDLVPATDQAAVLCAAALRRGNKLLFAGNGGSAADAQHLAAELIGKLGVMRPALAALSLTTDTSILTAVGNDFGFEEVFSRQVEGLGAAGDVLVVLSTSGGSKNVVRALAAARAKGMTTVGLAGATGGDMAALCDCCLKVPSRDTQKIQEAHIVLGHILCGLIERRLDPRT